MWIECNYDESKIAKMFWKRVMARDVHVRTYVLKRKRELLSKDEQLDLLLPEANRHYDLFLYFYEPSAVHRIVELLLD